MTTYEQIEKQQARDRLRYICDAVAAYPETLDPMLASTDLLELLRLAEFAGKEVHLTLVSMVGNPPVN